MTRPRDRTGGQLAPSAHVTAVHIVPDPPILDVRELGRSMFRTRWLILGVVAISMVAGYVITKFQDPEYLGEATVFVNPRKTSPITSELAQLPIAGLTGMSDGGLGTEAGLLQSRTIAVAVVDSLSLHVTLTQPVLRSRTEVMEVQSAPRTAFPGSYELTLGADGIYTILPLADTRGTAPSSVRIGESFQLGDVRLSLLPQPPDGTISRMVIDIEPFDRVVRRVRSDLEVTTYARGAQILALRARNRDRVLAAAIPNVAAEQYIRYRTDLSRAEARSAVEFLSEQVSNYAAMLTEAENRLRGYREEAGVASLTQETVERVQQLADLEARRNLLVAERDAIGVALARAEASSPGTGAPAYREIGSFPVFINNGAVQSLLRTLTDLENELSALLVRRTPENDDVKRLTERIGEVEVQLYQTARSYHLGLENQISSLDSSLARFTGTMRAVPQQHLTHARLLREQQLYEQIYTLLQTRLKEAEIREVEDRSDVRVLDPAIVPERPVRPRPLVNMAVATFLGGMLGLGLAFVRTTVDSRVRSRQDAVQATDGVPIVGVIPNAGSLANGHPRLSREGLRRLIRPASPPGTDGTELVVRSEPFGSASEAYRTLRTNLALGFADAPPGVITICSVAEGDGKSTTAANLALVMAQQGQRVILVDCDLRSPRQHLIFSVERQPGLADHLRGGTELSETVREVLLPEASVPAHVIAAGSRLSSPAEVIGSPAMRALIKELRSRYDTVILDAPPLGAASEALILGVLADATLLVARAAVTEKRALADAVAHLRQLRVPLAGIVINDADDRDLAYHSYGYGHQPGGGH
jgi:capsular exopolysaccharide synthesis family protein